MNPYLQKYKYNGKTYICLYNGIGYDFSNGNPRSAINMKTSPLLMPTFFPNRISIKGNVSVFFPKEREIETNHSQSKYLQLLQKIKKVKDAFLKRKSEKSDSQNSEKSRKEQDSENPISKITTDLY